MEDATSGALELSCLSVFMALRLLEQARAGKKRSRILLNTRRYFVSRRDRLSVIDAKTYSSG